MRCNNWIVFGWLKRLTFEQFSNLTLVSSWPIFWRKITSFHCLNGRVDHCIYPVDNYFWLCRLNIWGGGLSNMFSEISGCFFHQARILNTPENWRLQPARSALDYIYRPFVTSKLNFKNHFLRKKESHSASLTSMWTQMNSLSQRPPYDVPGFPNVHPGSEPNRPGSQLRSGSSCSGLLSVDEY